MPSILGLVSMLAYHGCVLRPSAPYRMAQQRPMKCILADMMPESYQVATHL